MLLKHPLSACGYITAHHATPTPAGACTRVHGERTSTELSGAGASLVHGSARGLHRCAPLTVSAGSASEAERSSAVCARAGDVPFRRAELGPQLRRAVAP